MSHALTFLCAALALHVLLDGSGPAPWRWVALPFTLSGATTAAMALG
jgi:hypothetical protein